MILLTNLKTLKNCVLLQSRNFKLAFWVYDQPTVWWILKFNLFPLYKISKIYIQGRTEIRNLVYWCAKCFKYHHLLVVYQHSLSHCFIFKQYYWIFFTYYKFVYFLLPEEYNIDDGVFSSHIICHSAHDFIWVNLKYQIIKSRPVQNNFSENQGEYVQSQCVFLYTR